MAAREETAREEGGEIERGRQAEERERGRDLNKLENPPNGPSTIAVLVFSNEFAVLNYQNLWLSIPRIWWVLFPAFPVPRIAGSTVLNSQSQFLEFATSGHFSRSHQRHHILTMQQLPVVKMRQRGVETS